MLLRPREFCTHAQIIENRVRVDDGRLLHSLDAADSFVVSLVAGIGRSLLSGTLLLQLAAAGDERWQLQLRLFVQTLSQREHPDLCVLRLLLHV